MLVVPVIRLRTASRCSSVVLPRLTPPSREERTAVIPASMRPASVSSTTTERPDAATTWAMPPPIVPKPRTATR